MSSDSGNLTPLQRALFAVKDMRGRLEASERAQREPIAVVGAACRFPGDVVDLESFWRLLEGGRDAITEVPHERWDIDEFFDSDPDAPGKMVTRWGGFLRDVDRFDAAFFGITPREAAGMDPQQRLFLEIIWEALEHAGIAPASLSGTPAGVFAGISTSDYFQLRSGAVDYRQINAYSGTGGAFSVAAGRVSYALGLNGPNFPVDTACSSSLVATHLACQSLRQRECNLALAGGVNLILSPAGTIYFSKLRAMARDGRCKTFDASADGYVRSEGCGFVVLERLSDAQANGHRVLALLLGSAVNHDGRSGGLTAPSRQAQEAVIRNAVAAARIQPAEVGYVEAHGTGTPLGDPIELAALAAALGRDRPAAQPLYVGSVKTNIGHTEAAAGVAGLLKAILAVRHGTIPPHLHFRQPNPYVPWNDIPVAVPVVATKWSDSTPPIAGVSAFGFSGTNAHVIVAAPPDTEPQDVPDAREWRVLPVSAKSSEALEELIRRYVIRLRKPGGRIADLCHTAGVGRNHFGFRAALVVNTRGPDEAGLVFDAGAGFLRSAVDRVHPPRLAFAFPESGGWLRGTGLELWSSQPAFREAVEEYLDAADLSAEELSGWMTEGHVPRAGLDACVFLVQYALATMWRAWGIEPHAVMGRGVGELAAACIAGILQPAQALKIARGAMGAEDADVTPGRLALVSSQTGEVLRLDDAAMRRYWKSGSGGSPVPEARMLGTLQSMNVEIVLDVGAPAVSADEGSFQLRRVSVESSKTSEWRSVMDAVARLYVEGCTIAWSAVNRGSGLRLVDAPTYPFERRRHWSDAAVRPTLKVAPSEAGAATLFDVTWEEVPVDFEAPDPDDRWLLLTRNDAGESTVVGALLSALRRRGAVADSAHWDDLAAVGKPGWTGIVFVSDRITGNDDSEPDGIALETSSALLRVAQLLAASEGQKPARLSVVTVAAWGVIPEDAAEGLGSAPCWGLMRSLAIEHPGIAGHLIDLPIGATGDEIVVVPAVLPSRVRRELALRSGLWFAPRLRAASPAEPGALRSDATYWIVGGAGALGRIAAAELVSAGARYLVLSGRSAPGTSVLDGLRRGGARVEFIAADVSSFESVRAVPEGLPEGFPPTRGVVHAAGILDDASALRHDAERLSRVFAPKVSGTWNLHRVSLRLDLDFFLVFSSAASLFGSPGQLGYAAANAFVDSLAAYRRSHGLRSLAINWGPWDSLGMSSSRRSFPGIQAISADAGARSLRRLLHHEHQVGVLPFDWEVFASQFPGAGAPEILTPFLKDRSVDERDSIGDTGLRERIAGALPADRVRDLTAYLCRRLEPIAGISVAGTALTQNLTELGVDSLMAMELIQGIRQDLGLALYPREFYEHPSILALADYLSAELGRTVSGKTPAVAFDTSPSMPAPARQAEPVGGVALLLSSPRSGSTLLRVMLAGHSQLFCPPELHLMGFESMGERRSQLGSSYLDEGLQRAFMEVGGLTATASRDLVEDQARRDVPVADVYRMLREMAGRRWLIDKSPTYASDANALNRAERVLAGARYIHLVRHPAAVIESFVRHRMDRLVGRASEDPELLAAQLWAAGNSNLIEFGRRIDPVRWERVHFESLVRDPERTARRICEFLDVPFDDAVLRPYEGQRMTDGVHAASLPVGDPDFLKHDRIEGEKAAAPPVLTLSSASLAAVEAVAVSLGYAGAQGRQEVTGTARECFAEVRGGRFCWMEWGLPDRPTVLCLHGILDHAGAWEPVALKLVQSGFRVVAPDLRGHGKSSHLPPSSSYHLLDFVADIDRFTAAMDSPPRIWVAHSLGAGIAALLAAARPDRVATLVLVEPPSPPVSANGTRPLDRFIMQLDQAVAVPDHPVFPDIETAAERLMRAVPSMPPGLAARSAERLIVAAEGGWTWSWDPRLRNRAVAGAESVSMSLYEEIAERLQARVTRIYGTTGFLAGGRMAIPVMKNVRDLTVPGGHNLHVEVPDFVASAVVEAARG